MNVNLRDLPAWGISLIINLGILGLMHLVVYRTFEERVEYEIISIVDEERVEELVVSPVITDVIGTDGNSNSLTAATLSATLTGHQEIPIERQLEETILPPEISMFTDVVPIPLRAELTSIQNIMGPSENTSAGGVEGALDRIALEIHASLRERQTLAIFLLDASLSLEAKRETISERIDNIYEQLNNLGSTEGLYTAVASYGHDYKLLTPQAVQDPKVISAAVRSVENDETGKEYVFTAISRVLEDFRQFRRHDGRWNKMIIIVTDERGDDADHLLEEVINNCIRLNFRCYVAGHAAIFGQQHGYVKYTYPEDGFVDYLPCDQGPETAFPQVLQIPFFGSGEDFRLQRMSAGYGPYALTRLCYETGGAYFITDETQGFVFDRHVMREYGPDYRPARVQEQEIMSHPAKAALVRAAAMTYNEPLSMPETVFLHLNDNDLRRQLTDAQMPAARRDYQVNEILTILKQGEAARDSLREPRWQAAFDLAMGRAIAMRVRLHGYNLMLAQMKQTPLAFDNPSQQNQWILVPAPEIDTGPQMRQAAADARMYLARVIDNHPDTPFARLAERELSIDMGWRWQPGYFPIPGLENRENLTEEEVMLLLAEELQRREQQRRTQQERNPPKL